MDLDRRGFLKLAAGSPLIFGLRELLAQEPDARPEWFKRALAVMKERKLHGVVILAPEKDPDQLEFGARLGSVLEADSPDLHELQLTGVFIFMTPPVAVAAGVRKTDEEDRRFLLDPEGKRIASGKTDARAFDSAAAFVKSFRPFLHGDDGERLKSRAAELAAAAPPEIHSAMANLGDEDLEKRDRASGELLARCAELLPWFAWMRGSVTDPEVASRLRSIIEERYKAVVSASPDARLPFGTRAPRFGATGCGRKRELAEGEEPESPAIACGRGRIEETKARVFLRFMTR